MSAIDRRQLLTGIAAAAPVIMIAGRASAATDSQLFGMVEIGSSGLKVTAYRFSLEQVVDDDGKGASGRERLAPSKQGKSYDVNTFPISDRQEDLKETIRVAIEAVRRLMGPDYGVPRENIAIVASSGVAAYEDKFKAIQQGIAAESGFQVDSVAPTKEAQLTFDWVVYQWRRAQVALIDIGSGNTKGGYYEKVGTCDQRFKGFSLPYGTKSMAKEVARTSPAAKIIDSAPAFFQSDVLPKLNTEIQSAPGLASRPRVYVTGGIVWATAMLVKPAAMAARPNWVALSAGDFIKLGDMIKQDDVFSYAGSIALPAAQRKWLDSQLTAVGETFSTDQLAAGNALCKGLSDRLKFKTLGGLFFPSFGSNAWSSQYLIGKFRDRLGLQPDRSGCREG